METDLGRNLDAIHAALDANPTDPVLWSALADLYEEAGGDGSDHRATATRYAARRAEAARVLAAVRDGEVEVVDVTEDVMTSFTLIVGEERAEASGFGQLVDFGVKVDDAADLLAVASFPNVAIHLDLLGLGQTEREEVRHAVAEALDAAVRNRNAE